MAHATWQVDLPYESLTTYHVWQVDLPYESSPSIKDYDEPELSPEPSSNNASPAGAPRGARSLALRVSNHVSLVGVQRCAHALGFRRSVH